MPETGSGCLVLKLSSVGVGVAGILVAFAFMSVQSALDAWWALASIFSGGMFGTVSIGVYFEEGT